MIVKEVLIDIMPMVNGLVNGLLLAAAIYFIKIMKGKEKGIPQQSIQPSELTMSLLKEIQSEHKRMQEVNSKLITRVAEINVWKDGHTEMDKIFHKGLDKKFDKLEDKIIKLEDK